MPMSKQFESRYTIGDCVTMKPPSAEITAVTFGRVRSGGEVKPFYTVVMMSPDGQQIGEPMQGVPESQLMGKDMALAAARKRVNAQPISLATQDGKPVGDDMSDEAASPETLGFRDQAAMDEAVRQTREEGTDGELAPATADEQELARQIADGLEVSAISDHQAGTVTGS